MGEIMFATWLLPYNEGVAQWVDPFYDAGSDSHTSIMGSVGANTAFYNPGQFEDNATDSGPLTGFSAGQFSWSGAGYDTGFNRRQEQIIQYWSPNWNGFVFRFAWTMGQRDETVSLNGHEIDPVIRSSSLAYTNGPFWAAVTWQDHEDWTADAVGHEDCSKSGHCMESSDAESIRLAARYIHDMGDGMSVQLSAMWEDLEYEFNGVVSVRQAMSAFGYGGFGSTGNLKAVSADEIKAHKTLGLVTRSVLRRKPFCAILTYTADSNLQGTWTDVSSSLLEGADTARDGRSPDGYADESKTTVALPRMPLQLVLTSRRMFCGQRDP